MYHHSSYGYDSSAGRMAQSSESENPTYVFFKGFLTERIGPEEKVLIGDTEEDINYE